MDEVVRVNYMLPHREVERLLSADWEPPGGAIVVRDDLSLAEGEESRLFRNARTVLTALDGSGGTKATATGNLNRKFVGEIMGQLDVNPDTVVSIRRMNKVINVTPRVPGVGSPVSWAAAPCCSTSASAPPAPAPDTHAHP